MFQLKIFRTVDEISLLIWELRASSISSSDLRCFVNFLLLSSYDSLKSLKEFLESNFSWSSFIISKIENFVALSEITSSNH